MEKWNFFSSFLSTTRIWRALHACNMERHKRKIRQEVIDIFMKDIV